MTDNAEISDKEWLVEELDVLTHRAIDRGLTVPEIGSTMAEYGAGIVVGYVERHVDAIEEGLR